MLTARQALNWATGALIGLLVGLVVGVYVEQAIPEWVPQIAAGTSAGNVDPRELNQAVAILKANYYRPGLNYRALSEGSVRGLIQALNDPFSEYLDPSQFRSEQSGFAGQYTGIGVYVDFGSGYPVISGVIPNSPASRAGLQPNDRIVAVNGKNTHGVQPDAASAEIQGPKGSVVKLTVQRGPNQLQFSIRREPVAVPFVAWHRFGGTLYVRIFSFGSTTSAEFNQALQQNLPSAHAIVLDLRENPGGYVSAATDIIDDFVTSGEAFQVRDRTGTVTRTYVSGNHLAARVPLVVLVDANSASAAEILAGSLQAHGRARLVGTRTFGKGSVQEDFPLFDGGDLHITVEHWFLPNGKSVQGVGLSPDLRIALTHPQDMYDVNVAGSSAAQDSQLQAALKLAA